MLTSQNLEAHLAHIRTAREHYRLTHPDDVAEIEAMCYVRQYLRNTRFYYPESIQGSGKKPQLISVR